MPDIRAAITKDIPELATLYHAFFMEDGIDTGIQDITANLAAMLESPQARIWVCEDGGRLIGFTSATSTVGVEFGTAVEVEDLYLVPGSRGRGLSRPLLQTCEAWARDINASEVFLVVTPEAEADQGLIAYYEKHGYIRSGRVILFKDS